MMAGFNRAIFVIKEENREIFREMVDERAGRFMEIEYAYQKLEDIPEGLQYRKNGRNHGERHMRCWRAES